MNENETNNALALVGKEIEVMGRSPSPVMDIETIKELYHIAGAYSRSTMVPEAYRGPKDSPGHANCFVALSMGYELGLSCVQALSHIYVVKGRVGIDGQLALALINKRAPVIGPMRYAEAGAGDKVSVTAWCIDRETKEKLEYSFSLEDARKAGYFDGKHSDQWVKNPRLMLRYRASTYLIRSHYPGVLMWPTIDELQEIEEEKQAVQGQKILETIRGEDGPLGEELKPAVDIQQKENAK